MEDESKDIESAVDHDEVDSDPSEPSSAPLAGAFNIMVSVPETIEIEMVDSSVLSQYETWALISSTLFSAFIAILVAIIQSDLSFSLAVCGIVFFVLFLITSSAAYLKRRQMKQKGKKIKIPFAG